MPVYDSTFILNPQIEEGGLDARIKEAVDLINANGGKVVKENRMGMRRMAYEIQKLTQGYYVSLVFEGTQTTVTCHYQDFSRRRDRKEASEEGSAAPEHNSDGGFERKRRDRDSDDE
jgi:small subunit ribosomal protein S6